MSESLTVSFFVEPEVRAKLLYAARAAGFNTPDELCRHLAYSHLGRLPPIATANVARLKANELEVLSLLLSKAHTVSEMAELMDMARPNLEPYIKSLKRQGMIEEFKLRRTGARPARTYILTLTGIAALEHEKERIEYVERQNRIKLGHFKRATRKQETIIPVPPELAGTAEGAYVSALFTYGTGTPAEKRDEYMEMWEEVARDAPYADSPGAMTWEKLTKEILEKVGK